MLPYPLIFRHDHLPIFQKQIYLNATLVLRRQRHEKRESHPRLPCDARLTRFVPHSVDERRKVPRISTENSPVKLIRGKESEPDVHMNRIRIRTLKALMNARSFMRESDYYGNKKH